MRVYFDTSAFAKRYIEEAGTPQVLAWCERADELALSIIALPELISAFCRLRRERKLTRAQYTTVKSDLLADLVDVLVCDTTPQVLQRTVSILEAHALRGMDAIHIGAALVCEAEVFVSADARQCAAAKAGGLEVALIR